MLPPTSGPERAASEDLTAAHLVELAQRGRVVERMPGETLVRQGDHADEVYVLVEGTARVEIDGREVGPPVHPGECVGELSVLDAAPRSATVIATSAVRLLALTAEDFRAALEEVDGLRQHVTRALTRRLRQVSGSWSLLAVDADVLLDAFLTLQRSPEPRDRATAVREAAELVRRIADEHHTAAASLADLTPAEWKVADLVAEGLSNAAIAARLHLSEHTVASHIKHMFTKLGCNSRVTLAAAVLRAR